MWRLRSIVCSCSSPSVIISSTLLTDEACKGLITLSTDVVNTFPSSSCTCIKPPEMLSILTATGISNSDCFPGRSQTRSYKRWHFILLSLRRRGIPENYSLNIRHILVHEIRNSLKDVFYQPSWQTWDSNYSNFNVLSSRDTHMSPT